MGWKQQITEALKPKPLIVSDLIAALGFNVEATAFDVGTKFMDGLIPLHGSFDGSQAQRVLCRMVDRGEVVWQRAANLDNWYRLPEQRFPRKAAPRNRTLAALTKEVIACLPKDFFGRDTDLVLESVAAIADDDVWIELHPFNLSAVASGWELADGDAICNWCFNTFSVVYPVDVPAETIARRMKREMPKIIRKFGFV